MPKYQKGYAGKLIVQDWDVITGYPDRQVLRIMTEPQIAALVSLCEFLSWRTRYLNAPDDDTLSAFSAETIYNLTTPLDLCELLEPCLEDIRASLAALTVTTDATSAIVEALQAVSAANATAQRSLEQSEIENELCGAATGVVEAMDSQNQATYAASEASWVGTALEQIPQILASIPLFGELPFDEMFEIVNWMFEHQVEVYTSDFDTVKANMICDLKCFVQANDNSFDWDVWNDWLLYVGETYPENAAAQLFARFAPARQTWINQIFAQLNKNASLQTYFDTLSVAWTGGLETPVECVDCDCPSCGITWEVVTGTLNEADDIVTATTALIDRLDTSGTAYGRPGEVLFASPVRKITIGWNTEEALDDMYLKLGDNDTITLEAPSGSGEYTFETPSDVLKFALGYSGSSSAFLDNPARLHITDACE